jgi:isopenicillin N synthase-like dioxygenase
VSVPIVDLSTFVGGSVADRTRIGEEVDRACREIGFFTVIGHGVDETVIGDACQQALAFFDLPLAEKLAVAMPTPGYPYGYSRLRGESLSRSLGGEAPPDLKETFNLGPVDPPPRPLGEMADEYERAVYAPNLWPDGLPAFRPAIERYSRAMADLAGTLMETFAVALGLAADTFVPFIDRHGSALRLAHYPAVDGPLPRGQLRAGAHTDYGTLTILWTDGEPGLEVETVGEGWASVDPVPGGLIVNLGDLMQRWTNDRWRSTMHRVVATGDAGPRLSIPFFHNANWDARVECIVDGVTPRHPPTTAGQHLMDKFRSTQ